MAGPSGRPSVVAQVVAVDRELGQRERRAGRALGLTRGPARCRPRARSASSASGHASARRRTSTSSNELRAGRRPCSAARRRRSRRVWLRDRGGLDERADGLAIATGDAQPLERRLGPTVGPALGKERREGQPLVARRRGRSGVKRVQHPPQGDRSSPAPPPSGERHELGQRRRQDAAPVQEPEGSRRLGRLEHAADLAADALLGDPRRRRPHVPLIAASVTGSMSKSRRAAMRTARSSRRASSSKRRPGSPTARTSRARRSPWPSAGSTSRSPRPAPTAPGDGVDGQVPPRQVLVDVVAERDAVGTTMVGIAMVAPERRDLEAARLDGAEAVLVDAVRKELQDALGPGVGGDVPVRDGQPQQGVSQAAAHEIGTVAVVPQASRTAMGTGSTAKAARRPQPRCRLARRTARPRRGRLAPAKACPRRWPRRAQRLSVR